MSCMRSRSWTRRSPHATFPASHSASCAITVAMERPLRAAASVAAEGAGEPPGGELVEGLAEPAIAGEEGPALAGQAGAAGAATPRPALEELEPGVGLQLPDVAPGGAVRHAHPGHRLLDRAQLVDQLEQAGPAVAQLRPAPEDHPDLHARPDRKPFRAGAAWPRRTA